MPFGPAQILLIALALAAASQTAAPEPSGTIWYRIAADDGKALGHASREIVSVGGGREIIDSSEVRLQEMGDPARRVTERTVTRQDAQGRVVSIAEHSQIGASWSRVEATIAPDLAVINRRTGSDRSTVRVPLPAGVRFDGGEGLLADWDMAATPRLEFENFNLDAMLIERVTIEAPPGAAPDSEGRIDVIRKRYDGNELRTIARLTLDRDRRILAFAQPMFGTTIVTRVTDRETAMQPHPSYHVLANMMVRMPFRMPPTAVQGHIRYRFSFRDGIEFAPPETGEQRIAARADGMVIDICATCGPGLPTDPAYLAHALRSTPWLQSEDHRIRAIAQPVAMSRFNQTRKMEMLLERAKPYMGDVDFTGHFSAVETLNRRSGDCTEAAVLLAALGRSAGIPTRVVSGLVYSRQRYHGTTNAFMPHSWVVAYVDGRWKSFDLALERFDSSHIVLTVGDGDPRSIMAAAQLASLLNFEEVVEVRRRPRA